MKTHNYKGFEIKPTAYEGGLPWYVQTYHVGGTPYAEDNCPHFRNLADAEAWIRGHQVSS